MKERSREEFIKDFIWSIKEWNPNKHEGDIARELLSPEGCTYKAPCTISIERTANIINSKSKRILLTIVTKNLIKQNPLRNRDKPISNSIQ